VGRKSRTNDSLSEVPIVLYVIFFLVDWATEEVCRSDPRTIDELKQEIGDIFAAVLFNS